MSFGITRFSQTIPHLSYKVWGCREFAQLKKVALTNANDEPLGETWEVSKLSEGESLVAGSTPDDFLKYIIKFIATSQELSIQVHPDDDFAKHRFAGKGKTECWLIIEAKADSKIYLGLKSHVTKEVLTEVLESNGSVVELMNSYRPKVGDFFYVPAGSIHAIGSGIKLLEVQQESGLTFRVWDWNRVSKTPRPLHKEDALSVISFGSDQEYSYRQKIERHQEVELLSHDDFTIRSYHGDKNQVFKLKLKPLVAYSIVMLKGHACVALGDEVLKLGSYQTIYCSVGENSSLTIKALENSWFVFVS
jgi:mannose-6-phosphate isomerase